MTDKRVLIDTDTAGDDTQAVLMAALSERVSLEGVTIAPGNAEFDDQVENAKYTLSLAGVEDEVSVHEGVRTPLLKDWENAEYVHGDGGLGGEIYPDTEVESGEEHAVKFILDKVRANPGEISLICIAPLTNIATALQLEPDLNDLVDEVWYMGGTCNDIGNVGPAAEFDNWVDPDAAKIVLRSMAVKMIPWGTCRRDTVFDASDHEEITNATDQSKYADFFSTIMGAHRQFSIDNIGEDITTHPDAISSAVAIEPSLVTESGTHFVDVDNREGMTRGYTLVDEFDELDPESRVQTMRNRDASPRTEIIKGVDTVRFKRMLKDMLLYGEPERSL